MIIIAIFLLATSAAVTLFLASLKLKPYGGDYGGGIIDHPNAK